MIFFPSSITSSPYLTIKHARPQSEKAKSVKFSGTDTLDLSSIAQSGNNLYQTVSTFFTNNNDLIQSADAIFSLPFGVLKLARKAPRLFAFLIGAEQEAKERKKQDAQAVHNMLVSIEEQGKDNNELLLDNFREVQEALQGISNQLKVLRDAPLAAANEQIISAEEALEQAHNAYFSRSKDKNLELFKQQMLFAFNHLSTAKHTGSSQQVRFVAAAFMSKCALMMGQQKTAVHNADDALREMGISNPDIETYYQLGEESSRNQNYKQANFYFMIGILKAHETDMKQYQTEHLTSSNGYRLAAATCKQLKDYQQAEILARAAVKIDEQYLPPYSSKLIKTYKQLGDVLKAEGSAASAIPFYEKAMALQRMHGQEGDNTPLTRELADAYHASGRSQEAKATY